MVSPGDVNSDENFLPVRRAGVVVEELDGEALVYGPECGAMHRFNGVVMVVWSGCDGIRTVGDLADEMAERYPIDRGEAEREVKRVIADFQRLGLLHDGSADGGEPDKAAASDAKRTEAKDADGPSLSRRRLIRGGVGMLVFAPPVISTFFATGSYAAASNPINPGYSPLGAGGCKNPGYSCTTNSDCCDSSPNTKCDAGKCCVNDDRPGCLSDDDCCNGGSTHVCSGGNCVLE